MNLKTLFLIEKGDDQMIEMNIKDLVNRIGTVTDQIKALSIADDIAVAVSDEIPVRMSQKQCRDIIKSLEQYRDILSDRADTTMIYF